MEGNNHLEVGLLLFMLANLLSLSGVVVSLKMDMERVKRHICKKRGKRHVVRQAVP